MALNMEELKRKAAAIAARRLEVDGNVSSPVLEKQTSGQSDVSAQQGVVVSELSSSMGSTEAQSAHVEEAPYVGKSSTLADLEGASGGSGAVTITPLTGADILRQKIVDLQRMLQEQLPQYDQQLEIIHRACVNDPDICHILTEEEIGVICAGLARKKSVNLVEAAVKKGKAAGKSKVEDLL